MNQIIKVTYYLVPLMLILGGYFYVSYKKLRKLETDKLQLLYAEISSEKELEYQFNSAFEAVEKSKISTKNKFLKIKTALFNIEFTLSEIFN